MRVIVGLGANALLRRPGERPSPDVQRINGKNAAHALAPLAAEHELVVTQGNGPQITALARERHQESPAEPYPLDLLEAGSEGMIGYLLAQELENALPGRQVATLLTQTIVRADDPAFAHPAVPVGPGYAEADARRLAIQRGWTFEPHGDSWRRLVPSPEPQRIVEIPAIRLLVDAGVVVVCSGGGGIPVIRSTIGVLRGVEAVVDKDLAAALLAEALEADALLLLTDVPAVQRHWGTREAHAIPAATPSQLRQESFAPTSMGPKVEAACRFVEFTNGVGGIGALDDAEAILNGEAGTLVTTSGRYGESD